MPAGWCYVAPHRHESRDADSADLSVVDDLPDLSVPGYVRDRRGTWRYAATGQAVPGARDLTLRSLHRFISRGGHVLVPVELVRTETELAWCMAWKHTVTTRMSGRRSMAVVRIPVGEWERRADVPFGMWAPELTASRLLDITEVARLVGVSPATITAYLSRRRMPEPVMRLGRIPVWSRPIIRQWLTARPGQGRRSVGSVAGGNRARRSDTLTTSDPGMVGPARAISWSGRTAASSTSRAPPPASTAASAPIRPLGLEEK